MTDVGLPIKPENIKKINFLDTLLVAFGGRPGVDAKLILKDMTEDNKHFTLKFRADGLVDGHETLEGKEKQYTPLIRTKLDFDKIAGMQDQIVEHVMKSLRVIDVNDEKYWDRKALPIIDNLLSQAQEIKKKEFKVNAVQDIPVFKLSDMKTLGYGLAIILNEKMEAEEWVIRKDDTYLVYDEKIVREIMQMIGFDLDT